MSPVPPNIAKSASELAQNPRLGSIVGILTILQIALPILIKISQGCGGPVAAAQIATDDAGNVEEFIKRRAVRHVKRAARRAGHPISDEDADTAAIEIVAHARNANPEHAALCSAEVSELDLDLGDDQ